MLPLHTRKLRLDPGELRSGLHIRRMSWSDGIPVKFFTEGCSLGGDTYYFGGEDPQIIIEEIPENAEFIEIDLEFIDEKKSRAEILAEISEQRAEAPSDPR